MFALKSQLFFLEGIGIFLRRKRVLTNGNVCALMTFVYIGKTVTENLPLSDAAESRRLLRAGAEGWGDLIPESVL